MARSKQTKREEPEESVDTSNSENIDESSGSENNTSSESGSDGSEESESEESGSDESDDDEEEEEEDDRDAIIQDLIKRIETLEKQVATLLKASKDTKAPTKKETTKKSDTKVDSKTELTKESIEKMTKPVLIQHLDDLEISYKKADKVADLKALLLKSVKSSSKKAEKEETKAKKSEKEAPPSKSKETKKDVPPAKESKAKKTEKDAPPAKESKAKKTEKDAPPAKESKAKNTKAKEIDDKSEESNSIIIVLDDKDKERGYGVKDGFVYNLGNTKVIGQLKNNKPTVLTEESIKKLKKEGINYDKVDASTLKILTQPKVKVSITEIDETKSEEAKGEKTYADDTAEGVETKTSNSDEEDPIKNSFEELANDSEITKEDFMKIYNSITNGDITGDDKIEVIAKKTGVKANYTAYIMMNYNNLQKKWAHDTKNTNVKGGGRVIERELVKKRKGGKGR